MSTSTPFHSPRPDRLGLLGMFLAHHDVEQGGILQPAAIVLLKQVAQGSRPPAST